MNKTIHAQKQSIEELLQQTGQYVSTTVGISMYPMLRNRRDTIVIQPYTERLKKYDVPLYKRGDSYVLHRIVKVLPDGYVICGDNCIQREYGIKEEQIVGVLTAFYRDDHPVDIHGIKYQLYVRVWTGSYPLRKWFRILKKKLLQNHLIRQRKERREEMKKEETAGRSYQTAGIYLLHLIGCVLNHETPEAKPDNCTWEDLWKLSGHNRVESIVWPAVQALQESVPPELYRQWEITSNGGLFRQLQFDIEREQILKRLSEEKISWLPLKGILLKDYYPLPGMRYMCDNDILYGITEPDPDGGYRIAGTTGEEKTASIQTAQWKLRQIMKELGYEEKSLNGNHDIFMKDPIFNFEMHRDLVSTMHPLYEYYRNPWKFAVQDETDSFRYHFSDEDEYIYLLVHAYKHYTGGGCGIRTLADEFVFLKEKGMNLDWNYLSGELAKLHLTEFEQELSDAASHAFTRNATLTEKDYKIIGYMLGSGTYGNLQNRIKNEIRRNMEDENDTVESARNRYLRNRLWISEEKMKNFYPFFYRHKMMRTVLPVYRIIKGIIIHPQDLIREARIVKRIRKIK